MANYLAEYHGHRIVVENRSFRGERLFVDGELQDERFVGLGGGALLWGRIRNPGGPDRIVKVRLGGWFAINVAVFVDDGRVPNRKY